MFIQPLLIILSALDTFAQTPPITEMGPPVITNPGNTPIQPLQVRVAGDVLRRGWRDSHGVIWLEHELEFYPERRAEALARCASLSTAELEVRLPTAQEFAKLAGDFGARGVIATLYPTSRSGTKPSADKRIQPEGEPAFTFDRTGYDNQLDLISGYTSRSWTSSFQIEITPEGSWRSEIFFNHLEGWFDPRSDGYSAGVRCVADLR